MKRLFVFLIAVMTSWWGYRTLRSHPRTAGKVAEIERHGQRIVDQANDALRTATDDMAGKVSDMATTAATGAHGAIETATSKAHEALDMAAQKGQQAISSVQMKTAEPAANGSLAPLETEQKLPAG